MLTEILTAAAPAVVSGIFGASAADTASKSVEANIANQQYINEQNMQFQREMAQYNWEMQEEFAKSGIQWKTEDAIKAGIHPVYALGAPTMSPSISAGIPSSQAYDQPTINHPDANYLRQMGQDISRAISAVKTPAQKQLEQQQISQAKAAVQKDEAIANYYNSMAAKNVQEANPGIPATTSAYVPGKNTGRDLVVQDLGFAYDTARAEPHRMISKRSYDAGIGAATNPFWNEYSFDNGFNVLLPYSEEGPSEALQNLSLMDIPYILAKNKEHYGPNWGMKALLRIMPRWMREAFENQYDQIHNESLRYVDYLND